MPISVTGNLTPSQIKAMAQRLRAAEDLERARQIAREAHRYGYGCNADRDAVRKRRTGLRPGRWAGRMNPTYVAGAATIVALFTSAVAGAACWWGTELRTRLAKERQCRRTAERRLTALVSVPQPPDVYIPPAGFLAGPATDLPAADLQLFIAQVERHANEPGKE